MVKQETGRSRDPEASRERIMAAAMAEFAAYGIAGARVDRIAEAAGCSKNLIYIYFTDKDTLFEAVLARHFLGAYADSPFTPDDLPGYAARVFDHAMAHPDIMRLAAWSVLEGRIGSAAARSAAMAEKSAQLANSNAEDRADTLPPRFLVTAIMVLATGWSAANAFGPVLDPDAAHRPEQLRANIVEAVRRLAGRD